MELERFKTKHGYVIKMFFKGENDFQDFMTDLDSVITEENFPEVLRDNMRKIKNEILYYKTETEDEEFQMTSIIFEDRCFTMFEIMLGLIWNTIPASEYEKLQKQHLNLLKEHVNLQKEFTNFLKGFKEVYNDDEEP